MKEEIAEGGSECCACAPLSGEGPTLSCAEKKYVFTYREQEVLRKIRESSMRAREIKERLRSMGETDTAERAQVVRELDELRIIRAELEKERIAAAEERMRLLGHINPDEMKEQDVGGFQAARI